MKKITYVICALFVMQSRAQGYQKMLADSVTTINVLGFGIVLKQNENQQHNVNCFYTDPGYWIMQSDSVFKSQKYKRVSCSSQSGMVGLMREDTISKKVYFIAACDTIEMLFYDFSLVQGDSVNYTFVNGGYMPDGFYIVDSIRLIHDYTNKYHRHFYLTNHSNNYNPVLEIAEGIGCVNHPLFLYYNFSYGGFANNCSSSWYDMVVSCKWDGNVKVYQDSCMFSAAQQVGPCMPILDSCNYGNVCGGIAHNFDLNGVSVFPNPASEKISISISNSGTSGISISIVNLLGVTMQTERFNNFPTEKKLLELDLKNIAEGVYFLRISNEKVAVNKKIIISR